MNTELSITSIDLSKTNTSGRFYQIKRDTIPLGSAHASKDTKKNHNSESILPITWTDSCFKQFKERVNLGTVTSESFKN